MSPVKHQGSCGSCWAFAAVAAMESKILIKKGTKTDLSEQHLVSRCSDSGSCGGGWPDEAMKYMRDEGIPPESCFPYQGRTLACEPCDNWKELAWQIDTFKFVNNSTNAFKSALVEHGPIVAVVTAPDDWFYYTEGVYEPVMDVDGVGWANHAVLLVGWHDEGKYWIVKNSWGANWGEQGYAKVKYGVLEAYNYAYVITSIKENGDESPGSWVSPISASASSEYGRRDVYPAMNAIDQAEGTHWFSRIETAPWLAVDLGKVMTIDAVHFETFQKDIPLEVRIKSAIGIRKDYQDLINVKLTHEVEDIVVDPTEARYLKIEYTPLERRYGTCTDLKIRVIADDEEEEEEEEDTTVLDVATIRFENGTDFHVVDKLAGVSFKRNGTTMLEYTA